MASAAQIAANPANAQHSTGPRTEAGKATVARNRLTRGLASPGFFLLPGKCPVDIPGTARRIHRCAQWKLQRIFRLIGAGMIVSVDGAKQPTYNSDR
jgi:hypothetical protein